MNYACLGEQKGKIKLSYGSINIKKRKTAPPNKYETIPGFLFDEIVKSAKSTLSRYCL